jgi:Hydrogenase/urease nickel incorporation, metallochaperone, hypA
MVAAKAFTLSRDGVPSGPGAVLLGRLWSSAMHEMGIASAVLEAVHKELHLYPGYRAAKVGLRIGEHAGVDTESLRFCFEALVKGTELEPLELEIEWCSAQDGRRPEGKFRGDELDLAYLELKDVKEAAA